MASTTLSKSEQDLMEKLIELRGGPLTPSPPPTPFSDLPATLQSEITITTKILKSFLNGGKLEPVIFSPVVISSSLAMLSKTGACKKTMEEIETIFGEAFDYDENDLKDLITFRVLIYSNKLSLSESFQNCWSKPNCLLSAVDFCDKNLDTIIKEINLKVSTETKGKISRMFDASNFTPDTSLYLGTAATFVNQWHFSFPFDAPKPAIFYSNPPREVEMIRQKEKQLWEYSEGEDWTCMNIFIGHIRGPRFITGIDRMLFILLPKEKDGLAKLIEKFDFEMIRQCTKGIQVNAIATIPTFKIESCSILNEKLKNMGINKLFEKDAFVKITTNDISCGLDLAVHAARININQFGADGHDDTEDHLRYEFPMNQPGDLAAKPGCREVEFVADHPFIFFVAFWNFNASEGKKPGLESIQFAGIYS